jgi:hypothetical protein
MKIPPVGAQLFHADRQTDMTKLTVAFRNFANTPNGNKQDSMAKEGSEIKQIFKRLQMMRLR